MRNSRSVPNQHPDPQITVGGHSLPRPTASSFDHHRHRSGTSPKSGEKKTSTHEPVVDKSRHVQTNTRTPKSTRGDTPSLGRPHPCLTTTDTVWVHPQNRKKNRYRPPNRSWSNPGEPVYMCDRGEGGREECGLRNTISTVILRCEPLYQDTTVTRVPKSWTLVPGYFFFDGSSFF